MGFRLPELGPSVLPHHAALHKDALSMQWDAVTVADKGFAVGKMIGCTMAGRLEIRAISGNDGRASSRIHRASFTVDIRSVDLLAPSHHNAVGALFSPATIVPTNEKIVIAIMVEDERRLDGVHPSMPRRRILLSLGCVSDRKSVV